MVIGTPLAMTILETERTRLLTIQSNHAKLRLEYIDEAIQQLETPDAWPGYK